MNDHDYDQDPAHDITPIIHHDPEPAVRDIGLPPAALAALPHDDEGEPARQRAFDSAFAWHGKELHGFTSSRLGLFCQVRLAAGAESIAHCLNDSHAFIQDAVRILWICSHLPEAWAVLRREPLALQEIIDAWGDEHVPVNESSEALILALRIYTAAHVNQHETAPAAGKGHGDDLGN